jgi:Ca-activated chloride channel family protein
MMNTKHIAHAAAAGLILMSTASAQAGGGWTKKRARKPALNLKVELDNPVRMANRRQTAILKIGLTGNKQEGDRPPVNLSIVLDRSGSMTGDKLDKAKEAAIAAVKRLGPNDRVSVVIYAHIVETIVPVQSAGNREDIISRINAITPTQGNTALFGGISLAAHEIRKNSGVGFIHRIVLISDGKANAGPSSVSDLGRLGVALNKEHISISTVGLGLGYDEDIMTVLAERTDGSTYFARASKDLSEIFDAEIGDAMSVVAKNVDINLDIPSQFKPIRIVGRDGKIDGQNVKLSMNNLNWGQEKYALIEVEMPATGNTTLTLTNGIAIGNAEVTWDNTWNGKQENATGNAQVRFTDDRKQVFAAANGSVINHYGGNRRAEAQDEAIQLADEGKVMQAAQLLYDNASDLDADGRANSDESMVKSAEELKKQADKIQKGLSAEQRKSMRAQSWQLRNQQEYQKY